VNMAASVVSNSLFMISLLAQRVWNSTLGTAKGEGMKYGT